MLRSLPSTDPLSLRRTCTTQLPLRQPKMPSPLATCSRRKVYLCEQFLRLSCESGQVFLRILLWAAAALGARGELGSTGPSCNRLLLNSLRDTYLLCHHSVPSGQLLFLLGHAKYVPMSGLLTCQALILYSCPHSIWDSYSHDAS